jgi:hypothetical protein
MNIPIKIGEVKMVRPTDREEMEYRQGVSDARGADGTNGLLGVLVGALVVLGLGAGAYYLFAGQSQKSDTPNIINVPAPQAPSVKIDVPKPDVPKTDIPKTDINVNTAPSPSLTVPGSNSSPQSGGN